MYAPWQMIVHACFGVLLFPLYIFVLINFLARSLNEHFRSYFFKIATVLGVVVSFNIPDSLNFSSLRI